MAKKVNKKKVALGIAGGILGAIAIVGIGILCASVFAAPLGLAAAGVLAGTVTVAVKATAGVTTVAAIGCGVCTGGHSHAYPR